MCGDRKVAIISAILIAIRAPLIVRLFENSRDYLKIIATIFCAKCVRTVNENRTGFFYIPSCKAGAPFSINNGGYYDINNEPLLGTHPYAHSAHGYAISAQNIEPVRFGSRFFCLCGHA